MNNLANELLYTALGAIIGSVFTAIFSTENFEEMVNFQIGKVRCRLNNQRHHYKYYSEMFSTDTGHLSLYRCEICGNLTTGTKNAIYDRRNKRVVEFKAYGDTKMNGEGRRCYY